MDGLFDQRDPRVTVALYRLLVEAEPVSAERLAAHAARTATEIAAWLRGADQAEIDDAGKVVASRGSACAPPGTSSRWKAACCTPAAPRMCCSSPS